MVFEGFYLQSWSMLNGWHHQIREKLRWPPRYIILMLLNRFVDQPNQIFNFQQTFVVSSPFRSHIPLGWIVFCPSVPDDLVVCLSHFFTSFWSPHIWPNLASLVLLPLTSPTENDWASVLLDFRDRQSQASMVWRPTFTQPNNLLSLTRAMLVVNYQKSQTCLSCSYVPVSFIFHQNAELQDDWISKIFVRVPVAHI